VTTSSIVLQTSCVSNNGLSLQGYTDPNCDTFELSPNGSCYLCSAGFTLKDGACVACQASAGCQVCDSRNTTKCLLCASGYTMGSSGTCTLNSLVNNGTTNGPTNGTNGTNGTNTTPTDPTPFYPSSAGLFQKIALFTALLIGVAARLV
jgi:hypothetical protein